MPTDDYLTKWAAEKNAKYKPRLDEKRELWRHIQKSNKSLADFLTELHGVFGKVNLISYNEVIKNVNPR